MEITWYGLSCFRIREGNATVICDPYDKVAGLTLPKVRADIVTISHEQPGHNSAGRVSGEPKIFRGPGEYEVNSIFVTGATTYPRKQAANVPPVPPERNIIFFFEFGDITVGHLGNLGEVPTQAQVEELNLGDVDILLIPVGGGSTLDPTRAVEVIGMFEPKLVIPMHYHQPGLTGELAQLESVEKFLKEFGSSPLDPQDILNFCQ